MPTFGGSPLAALANSRMSARINPGAMPHFFSSFGPLLQYAMQTNGPAQVSTLMGNIMRMLQMFGRGQTPGDKPIDAGAGFGPFTPETAPGFSPPGSNTYGAPVMPSGGGVSGGGGSTPTNQYQNPLLQQVLQGFQTGGTNNYNNTAPQPGRIGSGTPSSITSQPYPGYNILMQ